MGGRGASGGASGGAGSGGAGSKGGGTSAKRDMEKALVAATDSKKYPALSGSEKQVAWANSIRDKYFRKKAGDFSAKINHLDASKNWSPERMSTQLQKFRDTYSHPSWSQAKTWIDNRHTLLPYG